MTSTLATALHDLAQGTTPLTGGRAIRTRLDQIIYAQGDPADEVYVLTEGRVRLFVGEGERLRTTLLVQAPALLGDRDIIAGNTFSQDSAQSVTTARLFAWPREELEATLANDTALWQCVARDLIQRYARATRFADFLAKPVDARVFWILRELSREQAIELPSYDLLATFTDTTPKSVGRAVRALEESQTLRRDAGRLYHLEEDALAERGDGELLRLFHSFGK